jgi:hypothetical protein
VSGLTAVEVLDALDAASFPAVLEDSGGNVQTIFVGERDESGHYLVAVGPFCAGEPFEQYQGRPALYACPDYDQEDQHLFTAAAGIVEYVAGVNARQPAR